MTPGFTIDNLCKALGVHRNYSFLPLLCYIMQVAPVTAPAGFGPVSEGRNDAVIL